ncbi:topoisomerase 1-associated factor 1, partial [Moniliophthora roreri]
SHLASNKRQIYNFPFLATLPTTTVDVHRPVILVLRRIRNAVSEKPYARHLRSVTNPSKKFSLRHRHRQHRMLIYRAQNLSLAVKL